MKHINDLASILNRHLNWNKARVTCLAQMIKGLIGVKTVNLTQIATSFSSKAQVASSYRRMQRFFKEFDFPPTLIIQLIMSLFPKKRRFMMIMDRTNWKIGSCDINLLVLSIAHMGISVPIYWHNLKKKGNSNTHERMYALLKTLQKFDKHKISCLLADREFIGIEWFDWLVKSEIDFVIRIKSNTLVKREKGGLPINVSYLFQRVKKERKKYLKKVFWLQHLPVYLSASRSPQGDLLIVATPRFDRTSIKKYKRRWEIETLFGCLKSRGFNLEDTHLSSERKIEKLLFVVVIAFCWAYLIGIEENRQKQIPLKTHRRKSYSLFRYGYDLLRKALFQSLKTFSDYYRFLIPPDLFPKGRDAHV